MQAKIVVPIISSITIISLAVILVLMERPESNEGTCTQVKIMGMEFSTCSRQSPEKDTSLEDSLIQPPKVTETKTALKQKLEKSQSRPSTPLNSVSGNWNFLANTIDRDKIIGTITFTPDNEFSMSVDKHESLFSTSGTNTISGTYDYSVQDKSFTLTSNNSPAVFQITNTGPNYFTIEGNSENIFFARQK